MDVVQQKVTIGNDVAHVLGLLGIIELQSVDDFLRTSLDGFYVFRVLPFGVEGDLCVNVEAKQR